LLLASLLFVSLSVARAAVQDISNDSKGSAAVSRGSWFIQFYRDNCRHCETVKAVWEDLGRTYKGDTKIAKVNMASNTGKELSKKYGIESTPTFLLLKESSAYFYEGKRDKVDNFVAFIDGDYILVLRLIKNPLWVTIVLVPVAVIGVMIFFLIYAKPYESLEEFSMDIGIYTPKEQEEEELLTIGAESAELKTGGLTKRNV